MENPRPRLCCRIEHRYRAAGPAKTREKNDPCRVSACRSRTVRRKCLDRCARAPCRANSTTHLVKLSVAAGVYTRAQGSRRVPSRRGLELAQPAMSVRGVEVRSPCARRRPTQRTSVLPVNVIQPATMTAAANRGWPPDGAYKVAVGRGRRRAACARSAALTGRAAPKAPVGGPGTDINSVSRALGTQQPAAAACPAASAAGGSVGVWHAGAPAEAGGKAAALDFSDGSQVGLLLHAVGPSSSGCCRPKVARRGRVWTSLAAVDPGTHRHGLAPRPGAPARVWPG
jgi:hypothetical protein